MGRKRTDSASLQSRVDSRFAETKRRYLEELKLQLDLLRKDLRNSSNTSDIRFYKRKIKMTEAKVSLTKKEIDNG